MVQMRSASVVNLALFTTLTSLAASGLQANAYPNFAPPSAVPAGTNVRLNGSSNLGALNQALKSGFEQKYANGKVSISNAGTTASIDAVAAGKADIAAIGRPLTDAEKAKGLVAVPVAREKIAVIVGKNNPYKKDFTINQFAKAFRGEAKSWKDLGGSDKPIRFIDRVSTDTRSAFPNYPAFQGKPLASGANAVKLEDENPAATTEKLGADGVSFLPASMVSTQKGVRVLTMHGVDPSDKRYPFSQPLYYVYKGAQPNASVQAFLGYAGSGDGQTKIAQSGVKNPIDFNKDAEAGKVAQVPAVAKADAKPDAKAAVKTDAKTDAKPDAKTAKPADVAKVGAEGKPGDKAAGDKTPVTAANAKPEGSAKPEGAAKPAPQGAVANNQIALGSETGNRIPPWLWWLLLPLGLLGLLLWLLPKDEEDDVLPGRATTGDRRSLTGPSITGPKAGSVVGGAVDAVKGTATNLVDGVGDAANAGGAAVVGIGGAIAGAGAAAAARLRGEGNADRRTDDGEWEPGADANLDLGIETPDWNLNADLPDNDPNRLQGLQDRLGDGLDATKDAFGNVIGAGGGAIAGAGAAAAGLGAAAWSRLRGDATPDDNSAASDNLAAADWEFEGGLPENDPSSRMADYVDEASATGGSLRDRAKNMFGNAVDQTRDAAGNVMDGTKDMAGNVMDGTGNAFDRVQSATVDLKDGVGDAAGSTSGWLKSLFGKAKDATGDAANAVGDVGMGLKDGVTGVTGAAIGAAAAGVGAVGATVGNAFGVNQGRVVMVPYNSREALVRWDIAEAVRDQLRDQGGTQLVLRLYDVTDMDATDTLLPTFEQFDVDDTIKEQRILIPQRDRTYMTILGYLTRSGGFLEVSRSESVQIPTA